MKGYFKSISFRLCFLYLVLGITYIIISDVWVQRANDTSTYTTFINCLKGSLFVFFSFLIFSILGWRNEKRVNEYQFNLIKQNEELTYHAMFTAHELRKPVANIKGLIDIDDSGDEIIRNQLIKEVEKLDETVTEAIRRTERVQRKEF